MAVAKALLKLNQDKLANMSKCGFEGLEHCGMVALRYSSGPVQLSRALLAFWEVAIAGTSFAGQTHRGSDEMVAQYVVLFVHRFQRPLGDGYSEAKQCSVSYCLAESRWGNKKTRSHFGDWGLSFIWSIAVRARLHDFGPGNEVRIRYGLLGFF